MSRRKTATAAAAAVAAAAAPTTTLLETHQQEQVIQDFAQRIEHQRIFWKQTFGVLSVVLSAGVLFSYLTDARWYPAFLDRTTSRHTPSSSVAASLTIAFVVSLLGTGGTFFSAAPGRDGLLVVGFNVIVSIFIAVVSTSTSYSLCLPMFYQCICSFALYTLHDTDIDLLSLKKHKYNYKTA